MLQIVVGVIEAHAPLRYSVALVELREQRCLILGVGQLAGNLYHLEIGGAGVGEVELGYVPLAGQEAAVHLYPDALALYLVLDGEALQRSLALGPFLLGGYTYIAGLALQVLGLFNG